MWQHMSGQGMGYQNVTDRQDREQQKDIQMAVMVGYDHILVQTRQVFLTGNINTVEKVQKRSDQYQVDQEPWREGGC